MNRGIQELQATSECVPNIGARGRRRRTIKGVLASIATIALYVALMRARVAVPLYLLVFPLATYAAILFFQAKEKT